MLDTHTEADEAPTKDWEQARALAILSRRRTTVSEFVRRLLFPREALRRRDSKLSRLARHPLLEKCSRAERRLFSWYADEVECSPGDTIVRQKFIGHWFFLIDSGVADVIRGGRVIGRLHGGQYFGELALFGGGGHPSTIKAHTLLRLFVVHRRHFAVLIDRIPRLRWELISSMTRRLRASATETAVDQPVLIPDFLVSPQPKPRWAIGATRRLAARLRRIAWAFALLIAAGFALANYHPPVAVITPGPTFDVSHDIAISGIPIDVPTGKYLLTSIRVERPSVLGLLLAAVRADREIVPIPRNEDLKWVHLQQQTLFNESRLLAAAAAAKAQGMKVSLTGTGALITGLIPESPAAGALQRGDVIVSVDESVVSVAADAGRLIKSHDGSHGIRLEVERQGRRVAMEVATTVERRNSESTLAIGAFVQTRDLSVELPFKIDFVKRDIGGPSAGLVYALAISDMLNKADYAHGRTIAATGTIDADGRVGAVGGVKYKGESSHRAGALIFLVPSGLVDEASGQPFLVLGIDSLIQALTALVESQI
jgi:PDZ domain-containing protein